MSIVHGRSSLLSHENMSYSGFVDKLSDVFCDENAPAIKTHFT
jgi:hypothetical protein